MQVSRKKLCKSLPGQSSLGILTQRAFLPVAVAFTTLLGNGIARADVATAKMSPDLVKVLKTDPNAGLMSITSFSAKSRSLAVANPSKYKVLIRVNKNGRKIGVTTKFFSHLGVHSTTVTAKQLTALLSDPNIQSVSVDRKVISTSMDDDYALPVAVTPLDATVPSVGADVAGSQATGTPSLNGSGVTVAVIDSGVSPVDDLKTHIVGFVDMVNGLTSPYDDYGHGTHVSGIIAGDGTDSSGVSATKEYRGIAPGANIVGVKVLDQNGAGTMSSVIAGIEWCITNQSKYNIRVINMSLTGPVLESYKTDPVCQAVEAAVQAGIAVVVSAGNNGGTYGYIGSPANDPSVITVGCSNNMQTADRSDDKITTYTSRGPTMVDGNFKPDLVAPGNKIVSLRVPGSTIDQTNPYCYVSPSEYLAGDTSSVSTNYTRLSGTSMSAPAVAGAVALMLQENSTLKPNGVKLALMYSAQLLTGFDPVLNATVTYDPMTQGAGELNVPGAVQMASIMSPTGLTAVPSTTTVIAGSTIAFASTTLSATIASTATVTDTWWTDPAVWNDPALWNSNNLSWSGGGDDPVKKSSLTWAGAGDNLSWSGGGDDPVKTVSLTWGASGDNLSWSGGGDDPVKTASVTTITWDGTGTGANNLMWSGGGDNLMWSGGGDDDSKKQTLTWDSSAGANNLMWSGGGD